MDDQIKRAVLEQLRDIDAEVRSIKKDVHEVNARLGILEGGFGAVSQRVDHLENEVRDINAHLSLAQ